MQPHNAARQKKLLDRLREAIRRKHYSLRTERAYVAWVKRFILFHNPGLSRGEVKRRPEEMGAHELPSKLFGVLPREWVWRLLRPLNHRAGCPRASGC